MNDTRMPLEATAAEVAELHDKQVAFYESGATLHHRFRDEALQRFLAALKRHDKRMDEAWWTDLRKSPTEAYITEKQVMTSEIKHTRKALKKWMQVRSWVSPYPVLPSRSTLRPQPLGSNLILGAWNYPFLLILQPAISAVAAGNVAVLKPSELSPSCAEVVGEVIADAFDPEHVAVVQGGVPTATELLKRAWDHIFFTGGTAVGKIVAHAGAEHLSKVTLELGGKSPCIVMDSAKIDTAAARIAWGKWVNAGQTCIAPDYVLVHRAVKDQLVAAMRKRVREMYGTNPKSSPDFCRIVSDRHFHRVSQLIDPDKVAFGGETDASQRYIAPTVLTDVTHEDAVMGQEIFGPVLPMITIDSLDDAMGHIRENPNPLALYLFTERKRDRDTITSRVSYGGGCVNNVLTHLADPHLPFGGIRTSGLGAYHGKSGFDCFTHYKSVMVSDATKKLDLPLKYAPYAGKLPWLKRLVG